MSIDEADEIESMYERRHSKADRQAFLRRMEKKMERRQRLGYSS